MDDTTAPPPAVWVDLTQLCRDAEGSGPAWSHESDDLDVNLLAWRNGQGIASHVNGQVDVLIVGLQGEGEVTVSGHTFPMCAGHALLIPKGTERSIRSRGDDFRYLSLHRRRGGLWPTVKGRPAPRRQEPPVLG